MFNSFNILNNLKIVNSFNIHNLLFFLNKLTDLLNITFLKL